MLPEGASVKNRASRTLEKRAEAFFPLRATTTGTELGVGTQTVEEPDSSKQAPYCSDIRMRSMITWLCARRALMIDQTAASYEGLTHDAVEAALVAMPEAHQRNLTQVEWTHDGQIRPSSSRSESPRRL